jgi:peptidoglycan hydrolase CwlO-like protein
MNNTNTHENENMETMVSGFAALQSFINGFDATANYMLKKLADLDAKVDDLDSKIDDLDSKIDAFDIDDITNKVDDLEHLDSTVDELKDKIDNFNVNAFITKAIKEYIDNNSVIDDKTWQDLEDDVVRNIEHRIKIVFR